MSNKIDRMSDVEVISQYRMYASRPRSKNNMSVNDRNRAKFKMELRKRGIETWSNTSSGLGYEKNIGHIVYKDGSRMQNGKRR